MASLRPVTIVVPVYGDWPSLKTCIESLIETIGTEDSVLLVNDCGPDVDTIEKNILATIEGREKFRYERNKKNLGFVQTCNRAVLELDKTNNDIMLLNSDAALTDGTLQEMKKLFAVDKKIGSLSPRSNNATICTMPIAAINQKGVSRRLAYRLFKKYHKKYDRFQEVPTGHGFCMMIRRAAIKKLGLFDTIFGRGYGEEVDFSQRLRQAGWKAGIANWAFAYHLEARSFSMVTKQALLEVNSKIVKERYPHFKQEVNEVIALLKSQERAIISLPDRQIIRVAVAAIKARKKLHALRSK